jgi:hypothetical protein
MKKALPVVLILVVVGVVWFIGTSGEKANIPVTTPTTSAASQVPAAGGGSTEGGSVAVASAVNPLGNPGGNTGEAPGGDDSGDALADAKPAAEVYGSAAEALAAVLKGAKDYDDVILEQFTQPGDDCTWCPDFYKQVKSTLTSAETSQEQKSYLAEILAISGRLENTEALVESIKSAKSPEEADLFAEALELTVGKEDVARYLGEQMGSTNETLREAAVAAVTNQGSRLAAELLVKNMVERGDPDGYYSLGIGLGEFIPDEEAIPVLQDVIQKRDQFSHLGVKALINSGLNGLRAVFDELESSRDPENDKKMLKDALDHVNYEEGVDEFIQQRIASSKQPFLVEFAKQIRDEFANQATDTDAPVDGDEVK